MNNIIDITKLEEKYLPILSQEESKIRYDKGWSFSNIYYLKILRDIYLITVTVKEKKKKNIYNIVKELIPPSDPKKNWTERNVLEYLNALVNYELLHNDSGNYRIKKIVFSKTEINTPLSEEDKKVFLDIFFNYYRFQEISSWFIAPTDEVHNRFSDLSKKEIIDTSKPLYFFSKERFDYTFLTSLHRPKYKYIANEKLSGLMRFWDVYLKWGVELNLLDRFKLSRLDLEIHPQKKISIAYFTIPFLEFDLLKFAKEKFDSRKIRVSNLIFEIAKTFRYPVKEIKEFIISEVISNPKITYERTSEIFLIKGKKLPKKKTEATYLYPLIDDSYISHLIIRR